MRACTCDTARALNPSIQVGTAKINCSAGPLDLFSISKLLPNSVYDKQKFAAITIRIAEPACTVLLFTSGKMVLTGCRTFLQCVAASHEVVQLLKFGVAGSVFSLHECRIQNIVGNVDLMLRPGEIMDLESLHQGNSVFCTYQKNMVHACMLARVCTHATARCGADWSRMAVPRAHIPAELVAGGAADIR